MDSLHYFPAPNEQKFCSQCGHTITYLIPPDDNRERATCEHCGAIHYRNPLCVVGTIPLWQDKILLAKRAIEPQRGKWTLPAGFMELGETTFEGARRETFEETGAVVEQASLFSVVDIPNASQVHIFYLAHLQSDALSLGVETLEARFFAPHEIPWHELAFSSVVAVLQTFLEDPDRLQVHSLLVQ